MSDLVFEKRIEFKPAFDKRHTDPKKNYGIHGVDMTFYLIGEYGAIQFVVFTHWMTPNVQAEFDAKELHHSPALRYMFHKPQPADIGYHSHKPRYDEQKLMTDECPIIGGKCYYDGSSLQAEDVFKILLLEGSDGVWKYMEKRYVSTFMEEGHNDL